MKDSILQVISEIMKMKSIYRQGWLDRNISKENCESVADHSFSTAIIAWLIANKYFPDYDLEKILKYSLIHDLGEIYAGDITPNSGIDKLQKYKLEEKAFIKLFSKMENGKNYLELWQEFELEKTKEAKFVKQIDKLEMAFQAKLYEDKFDMDLSEFLSSAEEIMELPKLKEIVVELK